MFVIRGELYYNIVSQYHGTFESATGYFYRCWNTRYNKWNVTRRGMKYFQQVPREIACDLKLEHTGSYTHHAFRRTLATSLHQCGPTRQMIKRAGGWRSDNVVEGYIAESVGEKRKCATMLVSTEQGENCVTEGKKNRTGNMTGCHTVYLSGTFNNCVVNINK